MFYHLPHTKQSQNRKEVYKKNNLKIAFTRFIQSFRPTPVTFSSFQKTYLPASTKTLNMVKVQALKYFNIDYQFSWHIVDKC